VEFNELADIIFRELGKVIAGHDGLEVFAIERAKFEGWVKVELIGILRKYFKEVLPEENRIDVVADGWAIEVKTINTNYRHYLVKKKRRPITKNIKGILKDVKKLKNNIEYANKAVLFIVFPLPKNSMNNWQKHLNKIQSNLRNLLSYEFNFKNGIPAVMYLGYV